MGIGMYEKIPKEDMVDMWKDIGLYENMRELVCEIVAHRELMVEEIF